MVEGKIEWNMDIVEELLTEHDASIMGRISLSRRCNSNKLIWKDSMIREFSMKSAYQVARNVLGREVITREQRENVWKWI